MRTLLLWALLVCCPSIAIIARPSMVLPSFLAELDRKTESFVLDLQREGYTEQKDASFEQAGARVFLKSISHSRPTAFVLEYCGELLTGYSKPISDMEQILLPDELKSEGYKKLSPHSYRKGDITIDLYTDDNRFIYANHYIHVSRKSCRHEVPSASPVLNLRPTGIEEALDNLVPDRDAITRVAARMAFLPEAAEGDKVVYKKPHQAFRMLYRQQQALGFETELNSAEGRSLLTSIERTTFQKIKEETAVNNGYTRTYANAAYVVTVHYYGDAAARGFNDTAYELIVQKK